MKIVKNAFRGGYQYWFFCPGCKHAHSIPVGCVEVHANWTFSPKGLPDNPGPTFHPSLHVYTSDPVSGRGDITLCHLFVKGGKIEFCSDSPHDLNGKTVDLPDFPAGYGLPEPYEIVL